MKIKVLVDNVLIGDRNYVKGDVLDLGAAGSLKEQLVKVGKAEFTDEAVNSDPKDFKAAILPVVEDKATLFHPVEDSQSLDSNGLPVTAQSEILPNGKPVKAKKS